jgi:hypothetical protein
MSRTLFSLAGFQVIISGRFWVIAEATGLFPTEGWKVRLFALTIASTFATTYFLGMKSDVIRQKFHELHSAGLTHAEITKRIGISPRTASNWARQMGLPRRRGGPRRRKRWLPKKKKQEIR